MHEMTFDHKQAIMNTIHVLNRFIQQKKYSTSADNTMIKIVTPVGETLEISSLEEAELYKAHMQSILTMEKSFLKA